MEHILTIVFASTSVLFAGLWIHSLVKAAARKKDAEQVDFYRYVDSEIDHLRRHVDNLHGDTSNHFKEIYRYINTVCSGGIADECCVSDKKKKAR